MESLCSSSDAGIALTRERIRVWVRRASQRLSTCDAPRVGLRCRSVHPGVTIVRLRDERADLDVLDGIITMWWRTVEVVDPCNGV